MNDEINIFNVLKTKHNTTRPIQNIVQTACQPPVVRNHSPENQRDFSYSNGVKDHRGNENNIINFSDSIANFDRNTKVKINNSIRSEQARFQNLPGATLGELLLYMGITLVEGHHDKAIADVGINNIINNDNLTKVKNLVLNLEKIVIKLKNHGIENMFTGLVITTRINLPYICRAHNI